MLSLLCLRNSTVTDLGRAEGGGGVKIRGISKVLYKPFLKLVYMQ